MKINGKQVSDRILTEKSKSAKYIFLSPADIIQQIDEARVDGRYNTRNHKAVYDWCVKNKDKSDAYVIMSDLETSERDGLIWLGLSRIELAYQANFDKKDV